MVTEAIAAARAGDRARARDLFSRLLRSDSANAEYWVWMSSVVDTDRERIYCLESALKVDPTNREAMRGLVILGARKPSDAELAASLRIPRRQVAAVVTTPSAGARATGRINWTLIGLSTIAILSVAIIAMLAGPLLGLFRPRLFAQAPTLPPVTATFTPTPLTPTPTKTPLPASTRVWRTPVPTQLAQTPLAFFVPATSTPTPILGVTPHPRYEAYDSAVNALIAGSYQDALRYIDQVLEIAPSLPDAYYLKGEILRLMGRPRDAIAPYDQAITLNRSFAAAYLGRGRALLTIDLVKSMADYDQAVKLDPSLVAVYYEKSDAYAAKLQWEKVEETVQQAIDAGLHQPELYVRLSIAQFNRGNYTDALQNAIEGSADDPTLISGYLAVGEAYFELRFFNDALWPLKTYVAYAPSDPLGWAYLGRTQVATGDLDGALTSFEQALKLNDRFAPAYLGQGYYHLAREEGQAAYNDFLNARRYGPDDYFALYYGLGKAQFQSGVYVDAFRNLNRALELAGQENSLSEREWKKAETYAMLGLVYEGTNPPLKEDAIISWQWILTLQGASPETRALAEEHLKALTGKVPTRMPTLTASPTASPAPSATPSTTTPTGATATPTASETPTATVTPLQFPEGP